jgi:hypothetical protein
VSAAAAGGACGASGGALRGSRAGYLPQELDAQLKAALAFPGTGVLVTHDRRLLERFGATRLVQL